MYQQPQPHTPASDKAHMDVELTRVSLKSVPIRPVSVPAFAVSALLSPVSVLPFIASVLPIPVSFAASGRVFVPQDVHASVILKAKFRSRSAGVSAATPSLKGGVTPGVSR